MKSSDEIQSAKGTNTTSVAGDCQQLFLSVHLGQFGLAEFGLAVQ